MHRLCFLAAGLLLFGCSYHRSCHISAPRVAIPTEYVQDQPGTINLPDHYWTEFGSEELNFLVTDALLGNLNIKRSWSKIAAACAQLKIEGSFRLPAIDLRFGASHLAGIQTGQGAFVGDGADFGQSELFGVNSTNFFVAEGTLSYEIDLFGRIASKTEAACYNWQATKEDLEATALTLSGTIVDLWLTIQEQMALLEVIEKQEKVSNDQLELLELRYVTGQSTALDVFQQQQQLAALLSEPPSIKATLETSIYNLHTLMGIPPGSRQLNLSKETFHGLPPFPKMGAPINLVCRRPDLRAQYFRLQAADAEVASAVADIFPRLNTNFNYGYSSFTLEDLFRDQVKQVIGSILFPLFDGGRRRAEVYRRKAILCEEVWRYADLFLNAMREVEDALVNEKYQLELIERLEEQERIATLNLEAARYQYLNGLTDYLSVITAIQSLQQLERRLVSEKKQLLQFRSLLYRALGGRIVC